MHTHLWKNLTESSPFGFGTNTYIVKRRGFMLHEPYDVAFILFLFFYF